MLWAFAIPNNGHLFCLPFLLPALFFSFSLPPLLSPLLVPASGPPTPNTVYWSLGRWWLRRLWVSTQVCLEAVLLHNAAWKRTSGGSLIDYLWTYRSGIVECRNVSRKLEHQLRLHLPLNVCSWSGLVEGGLFVFFCLFLLTVNEFEHRLTFYCSFVFFIFNVFAHYLCFDFSKRKSIRIPYKITSSLAYPL